MDKSKVKKRRAVPFSRWEERFQEVCARLTAAELKIVDLKNGIARLELELSRAQVAVLEAITKRVPKVEGFFIPSPEA